MRDIRSTGQADLKAEITGPLDKPVFSGQASIAGGRDPPLLVAALARRHQRHGRLRRHGPAPRRPHRAARRRPGPLRRPHRDGRLQAGRLQSDRDRRRDAPALSRGLPLARGRRPLAARALRVAGPRRHGHRAKLGLGPAVRNLDQPARVRRPRDACRRAGRAHELPAALRRAPRRAVLAPHRQQRRAHHVERGPGAARHLRSAAAVRPRRNRARRGHLRGQALRRHARHDRLQQPEPDRAVLRRRGADARARARPELHRDAERRRHVLRGCSGASTRIRRCRRWTCSRCC